MHARLISLGVFLIALVIAGSGVAYGTSDASIAKADVLHKREFSADIQLQVASDSKTLQFFAWAEEQRRPVNWWTFLRQSSDADCVMKGVGVLPRPRGSAPLPMADMILGYNLNPTTLFNWMRAEKYITFLRGSVGLIDTPNPLIKGRSYSCELVNVYLPVLKSELDRWNARDPYYHLYLGRRQFDGWAYKNSYKAQFPAKGSVRIFAGRFRYHIKPLLPSVNFPGEGIGSIKMYLDPDTGSWRLIKYEQRDPQISLIYTHQKQGSPASVLVGGACKVLGHKSGRMRRKVTYVPYRGACKDGLANGYGTFAEIFHVRNGAKVTETISGYFYEGWLTGNGRVTSPYVHMDGLFRKNELWSGITRGTYRLTGLRWGEIMRNGRQIAVCRSDGKLAENCDARNRQLLLGSR